VPLNYFKITLVLAGSFIQYLDWCDEQKIDPKNFRVKYIARADDLKPYSPENVELVKYGTWYKQNERLLEAVDVFEAISQPCMQ
jgi:hypothetical protein